MINKKLTFPPLEKFLWTPMNDRDFSLSFFRYFRAFTHYELFVSFRSLNFGFKINRINPLLVIILPKLPAITNVINKLLLWVLQTISLAATYKSNSTTALCRLLPPVTQRCNKRNPQWEYVLCRHMNCLSRVLHVPAPMPLTTSDRCCVPHCLLVP